MYLDKFLLLSGSVSAQNVLAGQDVIGSGNVLSTNTIDLSAAGDIGEGFLLFLRSQLQIAVAGATAVEIQAITADDAALSSNVTVVSSTGAIAAARLVAGARFAVALAPRIGSRGQRYFGARYVITGAATAGRFVTDIGLEIQDGQKFYPSGFSVQ